MKSMICNNYYFSREKNSLGRGIYRERERERELEGSIDVLCVCVCGTPLVHLCMHSLAMTNFLSLVWDHQIHS